MGTCSADLGLRERSAATRSNAPSAPSGAARARHRVVYAREPSSNVVRSRCCPVFDHTTQSRRAVAVKVVRDALQTLDCRACTEHRDWLLLLLFRCDRRSNEPLASRMTSCGVNTAVEVSCRCVHVAPCRSSSVETTANTRPSHAGRTSWPVSGKIYRCSEQSALTNSTACDYKWIAVLIITSTSP